MDGLQLQPDGELPIEALDLTVIEKPKNRALNPAPIPLWDRPYLDDGGYKRVMMYLDCTQDGWNYAVLCYYTKGYGEYLQNMVLTLKNGPFASFDLAQEAAIERYYQWIEQKKEKARTEAEESKEWNRKYAWSVYTALMLALGVCLGGCFLVQSVVKEQLNYGPRYMVDQNTVLIVIAWILISFTVGVGIWKHDQDNEAQSEK